MNEVLRDRLGNRVGEIEEHGTKRILRDKFGSKLGEYDGHTTRDRNGSLVGSGDLLATLLGR